MEEELKKLFDGHFKEIKRYEKIRQIYLDDKKMDKESTNNRIDNFIEDEIERYEREKRNITILGRRKKKYI